MTTREGKNNGYLLHEIGSGDVASEEQRIFLQEAFVWLLDRAHWPRSLKESESQLKKAEKTQKRQQLRSYQAVLGRVRRLLRQFPQDNALIVISDIMSARIRELREGLRWVAYRAKDGFSWYIARGVAPAIGARLLLAVCIAKELWPERSPYQAVVAQMGHSQDENPQIVNNHIRAIEKQVFRVLRHPETYPVFGNGRATHPYVLLRHELFNFKNWREDQLHDRSQMSIEEFDKQFNEYLKLIHLTPDEEKLLARILANFVQTTQTRSQKAKRDRAVRDESACHHVSENTD